MEEYKASSSSKSEPIMNKELLYDIDTTLPRFTNSLFKIFEFEVLETEFLILSIINKESRLHFDMLEKK